MAMAGPRGAHMVGSVPLRSTEDVLHTVGTILGGRLRRLPDGETGGRLNWITWQFPLLAQHPQLEIVPPDPDEHFYNPRPRVRLRQGVAPDEVRFDNLGYADAALASFDIFARLQREGAVPVRFRFQVCLPTPLAPIASFVTGESQAAVEPAYEAGMLAELDRIVATVPRDRLAIQWDTAVEFAVLEGLLSVWFAAPQAGIVERLLRLGDRVPADVELGYHLCYGDAGHKHFKEPEDTAKLVTIANALADGLGRPLNWLHLPVPRDRDDDAYFAPLRALRLRPETELYLGLVHLTDGEEGTRRRIAAAERAAPPFGVAAECGFGRRPPETVPELLRLHAAVCAPLHDADPRR